MKVSRYGPVLRTTKRFSGGTQYQGEGRAAACYKAECDRTLGQKIDPLAIYSLESYFVCLKIPFNYSELFLNCPCCVLVHAGRSLGRTSPSLPQGSCPASLPLPSERAWWSPLRSALTFNVLTFAAKCPS